MRKRRWPILVVGALLAVGLAAYFEPTRWVRGWVWGEAFFDGRPSCYWRNVIANDLEADPEILNGTLPPPLGPWWACYTTAIGLRPRDDSSFRLVQAADADAVLRQLAVADDSNVARFAREILQGIRPRQPFPEPEQEFRAWSELLDKHRRASPND